MRVGFWCLVLALTPASTSACTSTPNAPPSLDASTIVPDAGPNCDCYLADEYEYMGGCPGGLPIVRRCTNGGSVPTNPNTQAPPGYCCPPPTANCSGASCYGGANACDSRVFGFCVTVSGAPNCANQSCFGDCICNAEPDYEPICNCPPCQRDGGACELAGFDSGVLYQCAGLGDNVYARPDDAGTCTFEAGIGCCER